MFWNRQGNYEQPFEAIPPAHDVALDRANAQKNQLEARQEAFNKWVGKRVLPEIGSRVDLLRRNLYDPFDIGREIKGGEFTHVRSGSDCVAVYTRDLRLGDELGFRFTSAGYQVKVEEHMLESNGENLGMRQMIEISLLPET